MQIFLEFTFLVTYANLFIIKVKWSVANKIQAKHNLRLILKMFLIFP